MSISRAADTVYAFRFLRLLTTPWEKTGAYKRGILDKNGKVIKKPETSAEKDVYNYFHRLVFNIKRLLNRIPLGKSTVASYLAALFLLKEQTGVSEEEIKTFLNETFGNVESIIYEHFSSCEETNGVLKNSVISPQTLEIAAQRGMRVINIKEAGDVLGIPIYEATVERTGEKIYISKYDI